MFPLLSCCETNLKDTSETVTFACLLAQSSAAPAEITWDLEGLTKMEYPATKLITEPELWLSASQLTVHASHFDQKPYTCTMKQEPNTKPLVKATIDSKQCNCGPPKPIQVHILSPGCNEKVEESNLELVCLLRSLGPGSAGVEWLKNGEVFQEKAEVLLTKSMNSGGTYFKFVKQNIAKESWNKGDHYTCKVYRPPKSENITMRNTSKCKACYSSMQQLTISVIKPSPKNLFEDKANLTCTVVGLNLDNVQITWYVDGKPSTEGQKDKVKVDASGSQNVRGFHPVSLEQWKRGTKFTCKAAGPCYEEVSQDVTIKTDSHATKPSISISRAFLDVSLKSTMALILLCDVSGFSPQEISISWQRDNKALNENLYDHGIVMPAGNLYNTYSLLKISRDEPGGRAGNYSCVVHHSSSETPITASENVPIVLTSTLSTNPFCPITTPNQSSNVTLLCSIYGYSLENIQATWKAGGKAKMILKQETQQTGGKFHTSINLTVPLQEWNNLHEYTCTVTQPGTKNTNTSRISKCTVMKKSVQKTKGFLEPASPKVMVFHTSEDGECQKLVCFATNFYPQTISIQWSIQGRNLSCSSESSSSFSLADGTFQKNCTLVLRGEECKKQEMYTCTVTHSSTTFIKKIMPSCGMIPSVHNKMDINMRPPSFEDLLMNKRAAVTCLAPLVNATSNSTIHWTMDGKPADMNAVTTEVFSEDNSTLWITSQLWVNLSEWRATRTFTCNIHNDLGETKQNLDRRDGIMKAPEVYLQQSSREGVNVTLVCMARNFYPAEIFLKWEEADKERSLKSYEAHDVNCNHEEQRCSLVSILEVPTSKWMRGVFYTCLVAHISSENIITRRASIFSDSWDCAIMGVALCDVRNENEDEYSELEDANSVWNKVSTFMVLFVVALFYGGLVTFIKVK